MSLTKKEYKKKIFPKETDVKLQKYKHSTNLDFQNFVQIIYDCSKTKK